MLYVKEGIHYKRRDDLEIRGIESIWIEVANRHKHILFGLFYRPPNSDINYYLDIENSLHLAFDTDISDIIITGDLNLNILSPLTSRKIEAICSQFSLHQSINGLKSVCPISVKSRRLSRNNAPRDRYTHAHKQCEKGLF